MKLGVAPYRRQLWPTQFAVSVVVRIGFPTDCAVKNAQKVEVCAISGSPLEGYPHFIRRHRFMFDNTNDRLFQDFKLSLHHAGGQLFMGRLAADGLYIFFDYLLDGRHYWASLHSLIQTVIVVSTVSRWLISFTRVPNVERSIAETGIALYKRCLFFNSSGSTRSILLSTSNRGMASSCNSPRMRLTEAIWFSS